MWDKFKAFIVEDSVFYGLLLVLIGAASFGLGRWSMLESAEIQNSAGVTMVSSGKDLELGDASDGGTGVVAGAAVAAPAAEANLPGKFVASKKGSKYHLPWCPGAKQMKEENKIWFLSVEEATAAGYTPAVNCKGI